MKGWISKKSRTLGIWRKRYVVLTSNRLATYKDDKLLLSPTEVIAIDKKTTLEIFMGRPVGGGILQVSSPTGVFKFQFNKEAEMNGWKVMLQRLIRGETSAGVVPTKDTLSQRTCGIHLFQFPAPIRLGL